MWPWLVKMPTQNLLRLLLLLVLILRSWSLVMKTNFCPDFARKILAKDFEAEVKSIFCCWPLVAIMKIILGRDSEAMFGQDFEDEIWSRFVWELVIWPKEVTLVTRTQPSGPLCLWQCFFLILCLFSYVYYLARWTSVLFGGERDFCLWWSQKQGCGWVIFQCKMAGKE